MNENEKVKGFKIDTEEDVRFLTEAFQEENKELFLVLGARFQDYSSAGNFLFLNWITQAIINLLQDGNDRCMKNVLGIDKAKMQ